MPAVTAFSEATGVMGPVQELAAWATDLIRYKRAPHQAKLLIEAAAKIHASGLPPRAVEDKLLRAVLEDGPMEDSPEMQDRWANLLANASTGRSNARVAFAKILSELEPHDAWVLDGAFESEALGPGAVFTIQTDFLELANLLRLGLANHEAVAFEFATVKLTDWGRAFVRACRAPEPPA